jgi:hypothetical protein
VKLLREALYVMRPGLRGRVPHCSPVQSSTHPPSQPKAIWVAVVGSVSQTATFF